MSQDPIDGLCFRAAHKQAGRHKGTMGWARDYSDARFYHDLLKHFQGLRHPEDEPPFENIGRALHWSRASTVSAIRRAAITDKYQPLSDSQTEVLLRLFLACEEKSADKVEAESEILRTLGVPISLFVQPLAVLAIDVTSVECFKFCKDRGAQYDIDLEGALDWYFDYSNRKMMGGILDLAFEYDFRNIQSDQEKFSRFAGKIIQQALSDGADILNWFLDHGAVLSGQEVWHAGCTNVHEDAMARLLQINAPMAIRSPTIQAAVLNYQIGTTKLLLEAGAPANTGKTMFAGLNYEMAEMGPMDSALIEIVSPRWMKNPETEENLRKRTQLARLLLEHGADVDEIGGWGFSARQLVYGTYRYTCPAPIVDLFKEFGYGPVKDTKSKEEAA